MKSYRCSTCKESLSLTPENWFPSSIKIANTKPNRTGIGKCRPCHIQYHSSYTKKIKDQSLTRSRRESPLNDQGTLYIIGAKDKRKKAPYKIGITTGSDINPRLAALQTAHWIDLEVIYSSPLLKSVRKVESLYHEKYKKKKVRGEWYALSKNDINAIIGEIEENTK